MAMTCGASTSTAAADRFTFGLADPRAATYSTSAATPTMWHHADWILDEIGNVQGIAFDANGNIYVAASLHNSPSWSGYPSPGWRYGDIGGGADTLAAAGTIYKLDAVTGQPSVFAALPQQSTTITLNVGYGGASPVSRTTGPGLFGMAYDPVHDQFYVANIEDGKIYIVESDGSYLTSAAFDPLTTDTGAAGPAPMGERVMAVAYHGHRVYYSIRDDAANNTIVRSVAITSAGAFDAPSDQSEIDTNVNHNSSSPYEPVTTDLEFSRSGRLAIGAGTFYEPNPFSKVNHDAGNSVWSKASGSWVQEAAYDTSTIAGSTPESYGGVAWGDYAGVVDGILWSSSADMLTSSSSAADEHGIIGYETAGLPNTTAQNGGSNYIWFEYDPTNGDFKGIGNDVELFRVEPIGIGNLVFADIDRNGIYDAGSDTPIGGVSLELYAAGSTPGVTAPVSTAVTDSSGSYILTAEVNGDYFVHIPEDQFDASAALDGLISSSGTGGDDGQDDDSDENGVDDAGYQTNGISSATINLTRGSERLDLEESGTGGGSDSPDPDFDFTIDFGFVYVNSDFGDAPDSAAGTTGDPRDYQTTDADGGAAHILGSGITLGASVDADSGAQQNVAATADGADEDGVSFVGGLAATSSSFSANVTVTNPVVDVVSVVAEEDFSTGTLSGGSGWVDASWAQAGSSIWSGQSFCISGSSGLAYIQRTFPVPVGATALSLQFDGNLYGDSWPVDYDVLIDGMKIADITAAGTQAIDLFPHVKPGINSVLRFERIAVGPNCFDNITITAITPGSPSTVNLVGWIDFDGNGSFDSDESTSLSGALVGAQTLTWNTIPGVIQGGTTYARFRLTTDSITGSDSTGGVSDGEVEDYALTVICPTITVGPGSLSNGTVGASYDETLTATGGNGAIVYTVTTGVLPDGLSISGNKIVGTSTTVESQGFTITATDASGCTGTASFTIGIGCNTLDVTPETLADAQVGQSYGPVTFLAGGSTGTVGWAISSGALPDGMALSATTGELSGIPTEGGTFNFGVTATDANICSGSENLALVIPIEEQPANIGNFVWLDLDGDGQQGGTGEVGLEGVLVRLLDADNSNAEVATDLTDGSGAYLFDGLPSGNYVLEFVEPDGYDFTVNNGATDATDSGTDSDADLATGQTNTIVVGSGDTIDSVDAGLVVTPGSGAIGNYVWLDENGDGVQDAGETGIGGVTVELLNSGGGVITTVITDANGGFLFDGLAAANYSVRVNGGTAPTGMVLTGDPDMNPNNLHPVTLAAGQEYLAADFGYNWVSATATDFPPVGELGAIGDRIWSDADGDGAQDPGEAGIAGVTVNLYSDSNGDGLFDTLAGTAITDGSGNYLIPGLAPDAYVAVVSAGVGTPLDGAAQTGDPDLLMDNITSYGIILGPGDVYVNADFGYLLPTANTADIGDTIYLDADADGSYSATVDKGIAGVTVALIDLATGDVTATTTTDENGAYSFPGLPKGTGYRLEITDTNHVLGDLVEAQDPDGSADRKSTIAILATDDPNQDFGFVPAGHDPGEGLIGDTVFLDIDGDGFDPGEGMEGVTVRLHDTVRGQLIGTTTTDENGNYFFGGLNPVGSYDVSVVVSSLPDSGIGMFNLTDPDAGFDHMSTIDLSSDPDLVNDGVNLGQDFGYVAANSISGLVWEDPDADGTRAGSEPDRFAGVTVDLLDANGNVIATTTTDATGAYTFANLPAGTFTVDVTDRSNVLDGHWHSLGADSAPDPTTVGVGGGNDPFAVIDFGYYQQPACIGDFVWHDLNGDGDQDSGEPGIGGVRVTLTVTYPNTDVVTLTQITSPSGEYHFEGLLDEDYSASGAADPTFVVTVATPDGFAPTLNDVGGVPDSLDSDNGTAGETAEPIQGAGESSNDFGFVRTATIGNYVWLDENGNGVQDAGEDGIPGVLVELHDESGGTLATTRTDANGGYLFNNVPTGDPVTVCVKTSSLPTLTMSQTGDPDATFDDEHTVTLSPGEEYMVADFGYNYAPATDTSTTHPPSGALGTIGDRIWIDADQDGIQDAGEAGIAGVEVKVYTDPDGDGVYDNLQDTQFTDVYGNYAFDNSPPDSYRVEVTPPAGYSLSANGDPDGTNDNATTSPIILAPGDVYLNADFGYVLNSGVASIGDTIYLDVTADGTFNLGTDVGIPGVTVALLDAADKVIATTTTDGDGTYLFPGLPSGVEYNVKVTDTDNVLGGLVQISDPDAVLDGESNVGSLSASSDFDQDFGYAPQGHLFGSGYIGDTVFIDVDDSSDFSPGEGIEGITVGLYDATGATLIISMVTNENGFYGFAGLDPTATYVVKVDTTGALAGLTIAFDPQGPADSESVVDLSSSGGTDLDQDFGYAGSNEIFGHVWLDPDADGIRGGTESVGFEGVTIDLIDSSGNIVAQAATFGDGSYYFEIVPDGSYTVDITDDANVLAGHWHSLGVDIAPDPAPVTVNSGNTSAEIDFGYYIEPAVVGNFVFNDVNTNGEQDINDTPILGAVVTMRVTYPNDDVVIATTTTAADGSYSFGNLLNDESYSASGGANEPTIELTVAAPSGLAPTLSNQGADDTIDSDNAQTGELAEVVQGGSDLSNDFGFAGDADGDHISDIVEGLGDRDGDGLPNSADYDPAGYVYYEPTGEIIPGGLVVVNGPGVVTLELDGSTGEYKWLTDGTPGTYTMLVTPPAGYIIDTGLDGGTYDPNPTPPNPDNLGSGEDLGTGFLADPTPTIYYLTFDLEAGDPEVINNNIPLILDKPDTYSEWQTANAGDLGAQTGPLGNNDGDISNNLLEYALCLHPGTGAPDRITDPDERGGFCLEGSGSGIDAFFTRPLGGLGDLTYTLEVSAALGSPTSWTDVTTGITPTVTDNGDGTETVRFTDLEQLDGTTPEGVDLSSGIGFARLRVDLSSPAITTHTEVSGWSTVAAQAECETCSNPFAPKDVFSGTIKVGTTNVLDVSDSAGTGVDGVAAQMANRPHYIEIIGGTYEGHRFEVASAADESITLAVGASRNTLDPIPDLTGAQFTLRAHNVLDDIVAAQDFVDLVTPSNNDSSATAGRVFLFDNIGGWGTYYAYNDSGALDPAYWATTENSGLHNIGDAVIDPPILIGGGGGQIDDEFVVIEPCAGFYVHSKAQAVSLTMVGVVREWDFVCPLSPGYNFIGCGYPIDQSPDDRDMSLNYFTGTPDPSTADQVESWLSDGAVLGMEGYESHFRVLSGSYDYWTTQEGSVLPDEDTDILFLNQRATFINSVSGNDRSNAASVWTWPVPWVPDAGP